jgi:hypothetical protein
VWERVRAVLYEITPSYQNIVVRQVFASGLGIGLMFVSSSDYRVFWKNKEYSLSLISRT